MATDNPPGQRHHPQGSRRPKRKLIQLEKAHAEIKRLRQICGELMHLVGCTIEALESHIAKIGALFLQPSI